MGSQPNFYTVTMENDGTRLPRIDRPVTNTMTVAAESEEDALQAARENYREALGWRIISVVQIEPRPTQEDGDGS